MNQASPIPLVAHPSPELLRQQGASDVDAERLAEELTEVCTHAEQHLQFAVRARQEQRHAWAVLCDRGWPVDADLDGVNFTLTARWLSAWNDMVALPVKVWKPHDMIKLQQVRKRLAQGEQLLRPVLPAALWQVVDPLDDTGRATLACVLQALEVWNEASMRCAAATRIKEALVQRFTEFGRQARLLSIEPPEAPLDLDGWLSVAVDARHVGDAQRHRRDRQVPSGQYQ